LQADDQHRLSRVAKFAVPATHEFSYIAPLLGNEKNTLSQNATCLYALTCPYELSNHALETSLALQMGFPMPHARFLQKNIQDYGDMDPWGDKALNSSIHAANTRQSSHNNIAKAIASLVSETGITMTADEWKVPYTYTAAVGHPRPGQPKKRRGDLMTTKSGLLRPNPGQPWITALAHVILDVCLGHTYVTATAAHPRKAKKSIIATMEAIKRNKYQSAYRDQGHVFAGAVCNSWGELGPELLRFLWVVAEYSARSQVGIQDLDFSLPFTSVPAAPLERRISSFKALRGSLFHEYRQRLLCVILEGVTERVFGRTYALASQWRYLQWQKASRDLWQPVFCPPQLPVPPVAAVPALRLRRNSV